MGKERIGTDCDEILFEFLIGGYLELFNQRFGRKVAYEEVYDYNLWVPLGISREEAFQLMDDFYEMPKFKSLPVVEGAEDGIKAIAKFNPIDILTSRPVKLQAKTRSALEKHFNGNIDEIIYTAGNGFTGQTQTKAEICRQRRYKYMIEDNRDYAFECAESGTRVLLLDKPWNRNFQEHPNIRRVFSWGEISSVINRET